MSVDAFAGWGQETGRQLSVHQRKRMSTPLLDTLATLCLRPVAGRRRDDRRAMTYARQTGFGSSIYATRHWVALVEAGRCGMRPNDSLACCDGRCDSNTYPATGRAGRRTRRDVKSKQWQCDREKTRVFLKTAIVRGPPAATQPKRSTPAHASLLDSEA